MEFLEMAQQSYKSERQSAITKENKLCVMSCHPVQKAFLTKEWNSFLLKGKKLDYLHLQDFLNFECECEAYLRKPEATIDTIPTQKNSCCLTQLKSQTRH